MFRKTYFTFLLTIALLIAGAVAVSAQGSGPVRGRVYMTKDGAKVPVADAVIDAYRVDGTGKLPTKTNKKGEFQFAGFLLGQTYHLAVSGLGISPLVFPKVKAYMESIEIEVFPGDGRVFTEAEAKAAANQGAPAKGEEMSAAEKKEQEDLIKKNAEIAAKNEKTKSADETAARSYKEGNDALNAKNYDLAISKFDEGINAVPDYVGSTPLLLSKKVIALKERGLKTWKEGAVAGTEVSVKLAKNEAAKKDFNDGLAAYARALEIVKTSPPDPPSQKSRELVKIELYGNAIDIHRLMSQTQVDTSKGKEATALFADYATFETDAVKKAKAEMILADILRENGDCDAAAVQYKKILQTSPEDPDALAGAGLCMFNTGVANNDKAVMQEGLNLMEHFAQVAPDTHKLKASVKDAVEYLKTEQKLSSEKKPATPKRKN